MATLTSASFHVLVPRSPLAYLNTNTYPSCRVVLRREEVVAAAGLCSVRPREKGGSFITRCEKDCDCEGNWVLEAEILEFMSASENPELFPTKKQLLDAGRMDLVDGIVGQGGWLAFGWHTDDEDVQDVIEEDYGNGISGFSEIRRCEDSSYGVMSSGSASSSGRSLEDVAGDDSGIDGILSRLEKERNMNFGFSLKEKEIGTRLLSENGEDDRLAGILKVADPGRNSRYASLNPGRGLVKDSRSTITHDYSLESLDGLRSSYKPESWRTWSTKQAEFLDKEFEETFSIGTRKVDSGNGVLGLKESGTDHSNEQIGLNPFHEDISCNSIQNRLQYLESELSSALQTLRSNAQKILSQNGYESSSNDQQELSDALEFQENEIMSAQDHLRSIRSKLVILEGKMALTIIESKKTLEEKQKRIDNAHRSLRIIRTASIVWPNSATEVFLAGSFDGWASKRKMEKLSTGIFSVNLKLYPGKYEIKFIVDGQWKIDPLRPVVENDGHQNNLLIIHANEDNQQ